MLIARTLVFIGASICRLAVNFAGSGKVDVEIMIHQWEERVFMTKFFFFLGVVGFLIGSFFLTLLAAGELL